MNPRINAPVHNLLRLTIPVSEALTRSGNLVKFASITPYQLHTVTLVGVVPAGIVECLISYGDEQHRGLRLRNEPEYPGEWPENKSIAWYERGQWVPCPAPKCGRALVWYEAGNVPGYRVCTAGHHAQLSADGRTAHVVRT